MNVLTFLRKPYLSIFMASLILFVSCEQYDVPSEQGINKFDYTAYNEFRGSSAFDNILKTMEEKGLNRSSDSNLELNRKILEIVNTEIGTNLDLPEATLQLTDYESDQRINEAIKSGLISKTDANLINAFLDDLQSEGFEQSIENYEQKVLTLSLDSEQFAAKNNFVNIMKSLNYQNPSLFSTSTSAKSWWRCALSATALVGAIASTSSCVTVVACGFALVAVAAASLSVADNC